MTPNFDWAQCGNFERKTIYSSSATSHAGSCLYLSDRHREGQGSPTWESLGRTDGRDDGSLTSDTTPPTVYIQCLNPYSLVASDTQPMCINNQALAPSPPLPFVAVAKAHLSMLKTAAGSQSTDSLGFLFCAIDCILHNMGAVQIQRGDHTQWVTHATPNVEHDHRWMWRHSTISMESHRTICCSFIAVPKPICSGGWCAEQHCILGNKGNGEEANYRCNAGAKCRAANYPGLEPNVGIRVLGVTWGEEQVKQIKEIKEIK